MPKVPAPRAYLDGLDPNDPATGEHYANLLEAKILAEGPESVLAFILEPVGGASTGALVPPVGYMERIREICDQYGVLLIMDEVMTGAGRTGTFLGCEHWGTRPDIVVMSKGIGSGYVPLGAMIADERLVDPVLDAGGFAHGFTYAGNPLACAAGLAVVEEIEAQGLCQNAAEMGDKLIARLHGLMQKHEIIGDVRGKGLLTAFEFMSDRTTKAPLPKAMNAYQRFVDIAYDKGLIVYSRRTRDGVEGDHILVCPPLIVNDAHLDEIIEALDASLIQLTDEVHPALKAG
jgi:adenosylmethionine-8-amino-7-oxononanoate aminotransferase